MRSRKLGRGAKADNARHVLGAGAAAALLMTAADLRLEAHGVAHIERADALRAVEFVRRQRQHVDLGCFQIDRQLARGLHRIAMK